MCDVAGKCTSDWEAGKERTGWNNGKASACLHHWDEGACFVLTGFPWNIYIYIIICV